MNELINEIEKLNNVTECNVWEKGGHKRLYVNFKSQNRFAAIGPAQIFIENNELTVKDLTKRGCAGAGTYGKVLDTVEDIKAILSKKERAK